jgi:hypothetical protein
MNLAPFAALLAALALPLTASAKDSATPERVKLKPIKYIEYDLPNGLHVILHENHAAPVVSTSGRTGVALVDAYDADPSASTSRFVNLSARTVAGTGAQTLIAGFVLSGHVPRTLLIRGIGPTLGADNAAVYATLGLTESDLERLKREGVI